MHVTVNSGTEIATTQQEGGTGPESAGMELGMPGKGMVVLWNLSIQKAVAVVVPNVEAGMTYGTVLGFGVCRKTSDPKIVKIVFIDSWDEMETLSCHPNHVEVFALSEGVWRSPLGNVPRKSLHFDACEGSVAIDGVVYWLATDRIMTHAGPNYYNLIVSFDATSEEFGEVHLPHRLSQVDDYNLSISKLRNHVVILELHRDEKGYGVWMMQSDVCIPFFVDSFVRIFSINSPDASVKGFRKTGEPVIELMEDGHRPLVVYDPSSTNVIFLENDVYANSFCVYPYVESLLLLDQPDFTIYDNGKATLNEELAREAFEAYM
ncbi:hypothetical protein QVD17_06894 [Tagetes erecta]|uniref:F-box associated beta-propeller type 1 domain-containing protein n=1 Tax=Tagetes erecta TaxID=13708 RepID=A0AAD8LMP1_TARER|nr:hypothetical protein QVD17_06894 [Tagetes erecta]